MRYLIIFLVSLSLIFGGFSSPILGQIKVPPGKRKVPPGLRRAPRQTRIPPKKIERIKRRIEKLSLKERKEALKKLVAKLRRLRRKFELAELVRDQALLEAEIERVKLELWLLEELEEEEIIIRPLPGPPPSTPPAPPMAPPKKVRPMPKPRPKAKTLKLRRQQFGFSAGYIAGIPGAMGEIRFHNPFDLVRTSSRLGIAYAQGEDTAGTARKHALVVLDGIYRLNPPQTKGIRSYFGLGINYDAHTTGKKSGDLGGQGFFGITGGGMRRGQTFFEIGYGTIRTGFSPSQTGATALIGHKF